MDDDSTDFTIDSGGVSVRCRAMQSDLIKVGFGIKGFKPFPVRLRVGQDREEAAQQHKRFAEVVARARGAAAGAPAPFPILFCFRRMTPAFVLVGF